MEVTVNKASEQRQHAEECRSLAKQMTSKEDQEQLLRLAETWDRLAVEVDRRPYTLEAAKQTVRLQE